MVQDLAGIVEDRAGGRGADDVLQGLALVVRPGDEFIQRIHVATEVLAMVEFEGPVADGRRQGGVREVDEREHKLLDESGSFVAVAEEDLESVFVLREPGEVLLRHLLPDLLPAGGVRQRDAGALEAGPAEAAAPDARGAAHGFVNGNQLRGAAFVVVDAALATLEGEAPEPGDVARFPGGHAFADAVVFAEEVFRPAGETLRHLILVTPVHRARDVAQEGLVLRPQGDVLVGLDIPGRRLALCHAEVIIAAHEAAGQAAEEDGQLEIGHLRILRDQAVLVGLAVEHQQMVLAAQGDAGLVQQAVVEPDVLPLRLGGDLHHFERGQRNAVRLGECHHVGDQHGGGTGQTADRQGPLDHALDAALQFETLLQGELGAAGIITPHPLLDHGRRADREIHLAGEGLAAQVHGAVLRGRIDEIHALVNGETGHETVLVIDVGADRADPVGTENMTGIRHISSWLLRRCPASRCRNGRPASARHE